jgi:two-component system, OmpR family, sensor kinase
LSRADRKAEALAIYNGPSRTAYDAASDALARLTDLAVANARVARDRLGVAYRQALWLIGVGIVIAGIMVVAALIYIRRSISAPLLHLADRMRLLAANDTGIDIPEIERRDEIGKMAQATVVFRNNAIELMRSQHKLARQAALLEEQLAQEQRLALAQRNFVSMASHEFRTPLTIIDGHARRLEKARDGTAPREIGERAGKIRAAVLRLTHLIDNMLSSGRLVDGGAELYFELVELDLATLLREVCQLHREMAPAAEIVQRFDDRPMPIVGDAKLLFQVFSNLLANAVKYSPSGGAILVEAVLSDDEATVAVVDCGIGIPKADRGKLFERYYRGANVSGIVGTGVGLYLVKTALDLHKGRIDVESEEGAGSRFVVRLSTNLIPSRESRPSPKPRTAPDAPSIVISSDSMT